MGGGKMGWSACHPKLFSTPTGTLEGEARKTRIVEGFQKKKKKRPLSPLEKSGRDSKNTLRAERPSGPDVNIQWVVAPERSDSQQPPWWICGVISFSNVLIRGQAVSPSSWLCCTDSCSLTAKNVLQHCCQVQPNQYKKKSFKVHSYAFVG